PKSVFNITLSCGTISDAVIEPMPHLGPVVRRKRVRRRPARRILYFTIAVCLGVLVGLRFLPQRAVQAPPIPDKPGSYEAGLAVNEVRFEGPGEERHLEGVIQNSSNGPRRQVFLLLSMWTKGGLKKGAVWVRIPEVPARGETAFRSGRVPADATGFMVKE